MTERSREEYPPAARRAIEHLIHAREAAGELAVAPDARSPDASPEFVHYCVDLQKRVERECGGHLDLRRYAQLLWEYFGPANRPEIGTQFENLLVAEFHSMDMKPYLYPDKDTMRKLAEAGNRASRVVLWSAGDVSATGYQVAKIRHSGIIPAYHHALEVFRKGATREQTAFIVDDDKMSRMREYLEEATHARNNGKPLKVVVVEDSRANLGEVQRIVQEIEARTSVHITFVPIWAAYSREGKRAEQESVSAEARRELDGEKTRLNAIGGIGELADPRFADALEDALVFVDFDGVLAENVGRREQQARVTQAALISAVMKATGEGASEVLRHVREKLTPLAAA